MLLSLTSSGTLPWSQARSDTECREMKENCDVVDFSSSVGCSEVTNYRFQCYCCNKYQCKI